MVSTNSQYDAKKFRRERRLWLWSQDKGIAPTRESIAPLSLTNPIGIELMRTALTYDDPQRQLPQDTIGLQRLWRARYLNIDSYVMAHFQHVDDFPAETSSESLDAILAIDHADGAGYSRARYLAFEKFLELTENPEYVSYFDHVRQALDALYALDVERVGRGSEKITVDFLRKKGTQMHLGLYGPWIIKALREKGSILKKYLSKHKGRFLVESDDLGDNRNDEDIGKQLELALQYTAPSGQILNARDIIDRFEAQLLASGYSYKR